MGFLRARVQSLVGPRRGTRPFGQRLCFGEGVPINSVLAQRQQGEVCQQAGGLVLVVRRLSLNQGSGCQGDKVARVF